MEEGCKKCYMVIRKKVTFEKSLKRRGVSKPSGFPGGTVIKNMPASAGAAGDSGLVPGLGRYPGGGNSKIGRASCRERV